MFHPFDGNDDTYACQAAAFAAAGRKASVSAEGAIIYAMAKADATARSRWNPKAARPHAGARGA